MVKSTESFLLLKLIQPGVIIRFEKAKISLNTEKYKGGE